MAGAWSRLEVEATVADYLDMLEHELRGESYVKSHHRRALVKKLDGRSEGAVERKHQNISAVLMQMGLPTIDGYKPLSNYQAILWDAVEAQLAARKTLVPTLRRLVDDEVDDLERGLLLPSLLDREIEAPSADEFAPLAADSYRAPRRPIKVDYAAREARNRSLGLAGEEFILGVERARLAEAGRGYLADRIEHVSVEQGDGLGFDIHSYEVDGTDRFIEVKTTRMGKRAPFYVSSNEVRVSEEKEDRYRVARVFRFGTDPRYFSVAGAISDRFSLSATQYRASLR